VLSYKDRGKGDMKIIFTNKCMILGVMLKEDFGEEAVFKDERLFYLQE